MSSTEIEFNAVLLYDFSIIYVKLYFHFYNKNCIAKVILTRFNNCFFSIFICNLFHFEI